MAGNRQSARKAKTPATNPTTATGPRERLLETAADLFYRQGYSVTGINQIIAESGTHKASFYRYFETKEDLALAYLELRGTYFREFLARLIARSATIDDFAQSWVNLTLREVRQGRFYGCPLANFRGQIPEPDARQSQALRSIIESWLALIADFLRNTQPAPAKRSAHTAPEVLAARLLKIYEGSAQLYRLTGDPAYLRSMKDEMVEVVRRPTSTQRT